MRRRTRPGLLRPSPSAGQSHKAGKPFTCSVRVGELSVALGRVRSREAAPTPAQFPVERFEDWLATQSSIMVPRFTAAPQGQHRASKEPLDEREGKRQRERSFIAGRQFKEIRPQPRQPESGCVETIVNDPRERGPKEGEERRHETPYQETASYHPSGRMKTVSEHITYYPGKPSSILRKA